MMGYSPKSPRDMSPDSTSPYPDRPIRPLPKRRLRERLSPEVADSIRYPPTPRAAPPLFYHPYSAREESKINVSAESQHPSERKRPDEIERNYISRRNGDDLESEEDEAVNRSRVYSRHSADTTGRSYRYVQKTDAKHPDSQPAASTSSSADGYDSFENTSNKKKRKIPTPGDTNLNGVHLSNDTTGLPGPDDLIDDVPGIVGSYHSQVSNHGISGPGRGRYGRIRNGRSPLRTLSDASGSWGNGRTIKQRQQWSPTAETPGIISRSIASANAEKNPISPSQGQENVSLLQQQASKKSSPASTQFTFTCDSQVPGTVTWPGPTSSPAMNQSPAAARMSTHATQTSPSIPIGTPSATTPTKQGTAASNQASDMHKQVPAQGIPPKTARRRSGKEYLIAARQRRHQQEFRNYHHPPAPEDIWICEFCEYERIFGSPPEALIKQYEIKDRRIRKQEAERRRLLEKAKMKGRKGKKGTKATPKSSAASQDRQPQHQTTQQNLSSNQSQNQSSSQVTQNEEYYDEEYDDAEYARDNPPPPSPTITQQDERVHSDIGASLNFSSSVSIDNRIVT